MKLPVFEFQQRRDRRLAWALLLASLLFLGFGLQRWQDIDRENAAITQEEDARMAEAQRASRREDERAGVDEGAALEASRAYDWGRSLGAVEALAVDGVRVVRMEQSRSAKTLRVSLEARDFPVLQRALAASPGSKLGPVHWTLIGVTGDAVDSGVRAEISAQVH